MTPKFWYKDFDVIVIVIVIVLQRFSIIKLQIHALPFHLILFVIAWVHNLFSS